MAKVGQGLARLIPRRAPGRRAADEAVVDAGSVAPQRRPDSVATLVVAPERVEPTVGPAPAPEPSFAHEPAPIDDTNAACGDEGFAELGDPLAVMVPPEPEPVALAETGEAAGFVDASDMLERPNGDTHADMLSAEHFDSEHVDSAQLYSDATIPGDVSELDFIAETDPLQAPTMPAYDPVADQAALEEPASAPAEVVSVQADASPDPGEAGPEPEQSAPVGANRLRALFSGVAHALGQKRVWIPAAGVMVLSVVGGLSFMLVKTSNDKAGLEAELAAARQAAKQPATTAPVAVIPPLLAPPAPAETPQQTQPESKPQTQPGIEAESAPPAGVEAAPAPVRVASATKSRRPVQMDCDVSDKASVSLSLLKCIETFNRASEQ